MNPPNELIEVSDAFWLTTLFFSLCVALSYFVRLILSRTHNFVPWNRVTAFAATITMCLIAVDGLNLAYRKLGSDLRLAGTLAVIAATMSLVGLHWKHSQKPCDRLRRCPSAWFLLVSSVCLFIWSSHRFQERLQPSAKRMLLIALPPGKQRQQVNEFLAITDRNHPIKVYRLGQVATDPMDNEFREKDYSVEYNGTMIQRVAGGVLSNCHGWVFLDGQYLITGDAVQRILDDHEYEVVEEAAAGDVIIYRDNNRNIVHSGLVRGVLNDGTVIIESKWGVEGVFLHIPQDTPYSVLFDYYRSPRPTHQIKIVPADELSGDR